MMPIVLSLLMFISTETPANAIEERSSKSITALSEPDELEQIFDPDFNQLTEAGITDDYRVEAGQTEPSQTTEIEANENIEASTDGSLTQLETIPIDISDSDLSGDVVNTQIDNLSQSFEKNQPIPYQTELNASLNTSEPEQNQTPAMSQITSVTQLSDVQPTDWAYQALQSLVERYGCIVGYPDSTYKGQRALTRFEFAAGMNACLDRLNELLATSTADLATKDDLATLQRLQEEFAAELAQLRGRVDGLEARTANLEANQFSTTTKLNGSAIFAVSDAFSEDNNDQLTAQYRYRLLLNTSFTGRDSLLFAIYSGNAFGNGFNSNGFTFGNVEVTNPATGETIETTTQEGSLTSAIGATTNSDLLALALGYSFPVGDQLMVHFSAGRVPFYFFAPILNGLYTSDEGTGAIGVFARQDPIYLLVGGGTGLTVNYDITDSLQLTAGYLADGGTVNEPTPGNGLFNGGYGVLGQLTWHVTDALKLAAVYGHDYANGGRFGFNQNGLASTGTLVANSLAGQDIFGGEGFGIDQDAVVSNSYSLQFSWDISPQFILSGWFNTTYARLIERGDGNILSYALTLAVRDVGKQGNLLGFAVGAEPYLTEMGGDPLPFDVEVPLHLEAFYRHQINDNISITPGVIWLTAPNQTNENGDALIATFRTTFQF
jgi:hypothetical protein